MPQPLDDYLARVARELRSLPAPVRENELREVRSHLEQLVEDFQSPGLALEDAQKRAIGEFALPRVLGAKLVDAWETIPFSWGRVVATVLGITALYFVSMIALLLPIMILEHQPEKGLFPEAIPILVTLYSSVPFGCGLLFSHWLGWRGRLIALFYFVLMFLILRCNLSYDSRNGNMGWAPDFFIAYINAVWLPFFNVFLGFLGSVVGHTLKRRARYQFASAGAERFSVPTTRIFFIPLQPKTWVWTGGFLGVCVSLLTMRVWLVTHPTTPTATLRNSLILDGGPRDFEPTEIVQINALPPHSPAELAGVERQIHVVVKSRAKSYFAANQTAFLKRKMAAEARSKYGVSPQTRAALARVQVNSQTVEATVRLIRTPQGWQIDEKSFDRSKLWSWFYVT